MRSPLYEKRIAQWVARFLRRAKGGKPPAVKWVVDRAQSYAEARTYYRGELYVIRVHPLLNSLVHCSAFKPSDTRTEGCKHAYDAMLQPKSVANLFALEVAKRAQR